MTARPMGRTPDPAMLATTQTAAQRTDNPFSCLAGWTAVPSCDDPSASSCALAFNEKCQRVTD